LRIENVGWVLRTLSIENNGIGFADANPLRLTPKPLLESVLKEWSKYKALPLIPKERFIK